MNHFNYYKQMIVKVAQALGSELLSQVVFVGGCTTGLLITDDFTREQVRYTDDVDMIVHIMSHAHWPKLQKQLQQKGFSLNQDSSICGMKLGELKVDFMPDNSGILGFSNRWYNDAYESAEPYLIDGYSIKLVKPIYFVATKLEAYLDRGNNDLLSSHDIEDLLNLFDGRKELTHELERAPTEIRQFVSEQLTKLLKTKGFEYAIQSTAQGDDNRESLIYERLKKAARGY